ncbi:MAG TPA: hypothetical protein DCX82_09985 [Lachnospiraceae bacterium]|jgi:hypothetical protein|nr:hypothetical protein [Lachnospiraceae bacterium]
MMPLILHKKIKHDYKVVKGMLNTGENVLVLLRKVLYHITDNYMIRQVKYDLDEHIRLREAG